LADKATVKKASPSPYNPTIIGISTGGTIDKAMVIAKKAIVRNSFSLQCPSEDITWGNSADIQKYYCKGDIPKAFGDQKRVGVENFGLMDTMLQLLVREATGQKWKTIYTKKVYRRKI